MNEQLTLGLTPAIDRKEQKKFVDTFMYCLTAPFIVWPFMEDTWTEQMRAKAKVLRLAYAGKNNGFSDECTDFEAMLYISSASLANPPSHEWTKIYVHLFMQFYPERKEIQEGIERANEWELRDLTRLKQWIFRKQAEALREKKQEPEMVVLPQQYEQLTLR